MLRPAAVLRNSKEQAGFIAYAPTKRADDLLGELFSPLAVFPRQPAPLAQLVEHRLEQFQIRRFEYAAVA
jgi:hypothetical protein